MKLYLIILGAIIYYTSLIGKDLPFNYERLNVNFYGVAYNGSSIIVYGNGGIILRTSDYGNSWKQIAIAHDSYKIRSIKNKGYNYYGILDRHYMVYSINDGISWEKASIDTSSSFIDMDISDDKIFILKSNSAGIYDLNLNLIEILEIDTSFHASEILYAFDYIFITIDSGKILRYNLKDNYSLDIIDFKELGFCTNCSKPYRLINEGLNLYANQNGSLLQSEDMGNNWFLKVKCPAVYNVKDGVIYAINSSLENDYLGSMNFFRSNLENKMDRLVSSLIQRYTFAQQYTDLIFIGRDTIITVGWDKTINISYDGGYTWHLKSNFRIEKSSSNIWLNDSTGFLATDYGRVFKTTNGGITWLPQKYTDPNTSKIETYSLFYIDKSGKGLIYYPISIKYFFNILYTTDHGETFTARADSNFWGLLMDGLQSLVNIGKDYLFIFPGKWSQNHFTLIFTMDSLFNVKSNTLLDSINLRDVRLINDSTIMALAIERRLPKGSDVFDSIDYYISYSTDKGQTWSKDYSFYFSEGWSGLQYINNYYLINTTTQNPVVKNWTDAQLHKLHPAKKEFTKNLFVDSLTSFGGKFILDGKMYMFGYQFIYTNEDFENNPYNWTKDSTSKEFAKGGSSYWTNDFAYLVTFNYQGLDNINFLKITPFKPTTYKENEVIPTQFWAYPPYPQPANKFVKSIIYWDQHFDIKDAMISIYNLMGNKIEGNDNIEINIHQPWSGELVWNCVNVSDGIYFILIKHGDATKTIPVVISK